MACSMTLQMISGCSSLSVGGVWPGTDDVLPGQAQGSAASDDVQQVVTEEWYEYQVCSDHQVFATADTGLWAHS